MVILGTAPDARVGSEFEGLAQLVIQIPFSIQASFSSENVDCYLSSGSQLVIQ